MQKSFMFVFVIALSLCAYSGLALAQKDMMKDKSHDGHKMTIQLSGGAEVPGPGDTDGNGMVNLTFNPSKGEVCYDVSVKDIKAATMAHIHAGAAGQAGDVKVKFDPPAKGSSKGCTAVDATLLKDIMDNPANYYVNVHNAEFPNGALRGQLGK